MENKYYIPNIDEFTSDFHYEYFNGKVWIKSSDFTNDWDYEDNPHYAVMKGIDNGIIRVKYLDASDIEELGFTYKGKTIDVWFEKEGNFDMGTWTSYKCQLHYGLHDNRLFIDMIDMGDEVRVFNGIVKNKSELKKVLNMLNIK